MARSYAQLAAVVFFITALGGLIAGQPGHTAQMAAGSHVRAISVGNWADFDGVALHLTYVRDALNLVLAGVFFYAGWRAKPRQAAWLVTAAGTFLLALAVVGFVVNDTDTASRSLLALHFPLAINIFDLIAGVLGVLCGLGGLDREPAVA